MGPVPGRSTGFVGRFEEADHVAKVVHAGDCIGC